MPVVLSGSYEALVSEASRCIASDEVDQAISILRRIIKRLTILRPETLDKRPKLKGMLLGAWTNLLALLRERGLYDEAISVTEDVYGHLALPRERRQAIGILEIEAGKVEQGLSRLQEVADEFQDVPSLLIMANAYVYLGRCEDAVKVLQRALGLATNDQDAAQVYYGLFSVYRHMGRVEEGLDAWNMAVVLNPDLGDAIHLVYRWMIECGELEQAKRYLDREKDELLRLLGQGIMEWRRGDLQAAEALWRQVLEREPRTIMDVETIMEAALWLGETDPVADMSARLAEEEVAPSTEVMVMLAIAAAMDGEWLAAERWLKLAYRRLMRTSMPVRKISTRWWQMFNRCLPDSEELRGFAQYFETDYQCQEPDGPSPE